MVTIVVDPEDGGVMAGTQLPPPPGFIPTPIRYLIGQPLDAAADCYLVHGQPYLLYPQWDYAEAWGGEYVKEIHPFFVALEGSPISVEEFWQRVASSPAHA